MDIENMDIEQVKILTVKFLDTVPQQVFITLSDGSVGVMDIEKWNQLDKGDEEYDIV